MPSKVTFSADDPSEAIATALHDAIDRKVSSWTHAAESYRRGLRPEDYDPGHPWYYYLGGIPIDPDAIESRRDLLADQEGFFNFPKAKNPKLLRNEIHMARKELRRSIHSFNELCGRTRVKSKKWIPPWETDRKLGLASSLSLVFSHICYEKGYLRFLNRLLCQHHLSISPTKISLPVSSAPPSNTPRSRKPPRKNSKPSSRP